LLHTFSIHFKLQYIGTLPQRYIHRHKHTIQNTISDHVTANINRISPFFLVCVLLSLSVFLSIPPSSLLLTCSFASFRIIVSSSRSIIPVPSASKCCNNSQNSLSLA